MPNYVELIKVKEPQEIGQEKKRGGKEKKK